MLLPRVTIVIVNWNKKADVIQLLDSVARVEYDNYRVVVVDNASDDDSVEAIQAHPLLLTLIENSENLGGTGGFNTGLNYALDHGSQDYVWLLDNDATVTPMALKALINVMEDDRSIALAGSKILNADQPGKVVETGANINWRTGNVAPLNQNCDDSDGLEAVFDVDYVAICSALVRESALRDVGVMDQRYFLLWDDMDWGASFKYRGYRVVAVGSSKVRHSAFTEKRNVMIDHYLGVRNPLLTVSKHARGLDRLKGLTAILRRALYFRFLFAVTGRVSQAHVSKRAILDFLNEKWGKFPCFQSQKPAFLGVAASQVNFEDKSLLILPLGAESEIARMVEVLRQMYGDTVKLTVLVQSYRQHLFDDMRIDEVLVFNPMRQNVIAENLRTLARIFTGRFDGAVTVDVDKLTPFSFAVPKTYFFDPVRRELFPLGEGYAELWRVAYALLAGEFMVWVLLPFVYRKALFYQTKQELS